MSDQLATSYNLINMGMISLINTNIEFLNLKMQKTPQSFEWTKLNTSKQEFIKARNNLAKPNPAMVQNLAKKLLYIPLETTSGNFHPLLFLHYYSNIITYLIISQK